ncbi:MAG: glutaredoxin family protein [Candidatus Methanomethylicia archaeon]|jgi:glutaredoxin|nr:glutaredoxin family protein [Candidatus Methanomethylicia archaeon]MCQ5374526.1 glutaredoxin family protein [Candidatus Methanomethylicia archaeon]NHV60612.1 glutaredoxin family protein [Candidatus Verstraetearchaeota archaeon]
MIKLFTHEGCANCRKAKKLLQMVLPDFGASYEAHVLEMDIEDPEALAELLMLNTERVPTITIGGKVLSGEDAIDEGKIRAALSSELKR